MRRSTTLIVSHCKSDLNDESQVKICISDLYNLLCALSDEDVNCNDINYVEGTDLLTDDLDLYLKSFCDCFLNTAKIVISENEGNNGSDNISKPVISEDNKKSLKQFIETLALSNTTASDSLGSDYSRQYAGKYTDAQMKFIPMWNEFIKVAYKNDDFANAFKRIKAQPCSWVEFGAGMSKIGKIYINLSPSKKSVRVFFSKKVDCNEWKNILEDQDTIVKKFDGNALFECIGKGATEINKITRFFNRVDFDNLADEENVFAEVAKYIVDLRNIIIWYIK